MEINVCTVKSFSAVARVRQTKIYSQQSTVSAKSSRPPRQCCRSSRFLEPIFNYVFTSNLYY